MKKVIRTVFAAVCVVVAGLGGLRAYNTANLSETEMLLAENIEALSVGEQQDQNDGTKPASGNCTEPASEDCTYTDSDGNLHTRCGYTNTKTTK